MDEIKWAVDGPTLNWVDEIKWAVDGPTLNWVDEIKWAVDCPTLNWVDEIKWTVDGPTLNWVDEIKRALNGSKLPHKRPGGRMMNEFHGHRSQALPGVKGGTHLRSLPRGEEWGIGEGSDPDLQKSRPHTPK